MKKTATRCSLYLFSPSAPCQSCVYMFVVHWDCMQGKGEAVYEANYKRVITLKHFGLAFCEVALNTYNNR